jgi:hypothetical protein
VTAANPLPAIRGLRVASADDRAAMGVGAAGTVVGEVETLPERLVTAGEFERADDPPGWWVRWRHALTDQWFRIDRERVRQQLMVGRMRSDAAAPLTDDDLDAITARLVALLDAQAARPARTVSVQTVEAAVAPRFLGRFKFWIDRDDALRWRPCMADPVRGQGGSPPPPPELTQQGDRPPLVERWRRRNDPVGDPVTPAALEAAALSSGLLAHGERPDCAGVIAELHTLVLTS